jgi:hypothetical protein
MTHEGMWRIYSNPDPHGEHEINVENQYTFQQLKNAAIL